jgi:hypothetical protein
MNIKLHLDEAESAPVVRLAETLRVAPEDVLYAALDRLMIGARDPAVQKSILQIRQAKTSLPLWADTAGSVHAYEGMPPCGAEKSKYSV